MSQAKFITRLQQTWTEVKKPLSLFLATLHRERVFQLFSLIAILIFLSALGFAYQESQGETFWDRLAQGLWWAAVTISTVGYGDVVPQTLGGRLVGVTLIFSGLVIISLLTATLASVFVERKIRRERGLENIRATNHFVILGWHRNGDQVIQNLLHRLDRQTPIVLVNNLPPEEFEALKDRFPDVTLQFVRGDFVREEILLKANLPRARKAVILADRVEELPREQVDQRTLLTALAIKAINPQIKVCAELLHPDNRPHLERARVEDIIIRGEYDSALIASATESAGVFKVLRTLLSPDAPNFWAMEIPPRFVNGPLSDFSAYLRRQHQALLIALFSEGQKLRLEDLLSSEHSAIDDFIYRKFSEAGKTHLFGGHKVDFLINPPDDHLINPNEIAVVIATEQPLAAKGGKTS